MTLGGVWALCIATVAGTAYAQDAGTQDASRVGRDGEIAADSDAAPRPSSPSIVAPTLLNRATPVYPAGADGRRVDVEMLLTVDADGRVGQAEVLGHVPSDAPASFDEAARQAAAQLRFAPARRNGVAIAVRLRFHLPIVAPLVAMDAGVGDSTSIPEFAEEGAGIEGMTHSHGLAASGDGHSTASSNHGTPQADADGRARGTATHSANTIQSLTVVRSPADNVVRVRSTPAAPSRGASEFAYTITPGLRQVPRANATDFLRLAPGILLTNEGGEGHSEQVFLRGFDAHEGQDIEFVVNGMPINEVGNPHGEGLVDTHFILPELVRSIRVLEGPFDPHQGNYAVAGSAEYELGASQSGLSVQYSIASFNTHRVLAMWSPESSNGRTFAGADLRTTDGFGQNRAATLGRAMAQWEHALSESTTVRLLATTYATQYGSAGVLRRDDVLSGARDFYGTYDSTQGGDSMRHTLSATVEDSVPGRLLRFQLFGGLRSFRLRENYTGFVEDRPAPYRSGITQRGDMVDKNSLAQTVGARGSVRLSAPWRGNTQAIEAGFYGRFDHVDASQQRLRALTVTPYRVDFDLEHAVANVGVYLDTELRPVSWLSLRGGVRADYFSFNVLSRCDLHDTVLPGGTTVVDQLCYTRDRVGPRDPSARRSAGAIAVQPRATLSVGPFSSFLFTASVGTGARSADPTYIADSTFAPFVGLTATEAGVVYHKSLSGSSSLTVRTLYYLTYVGRDLIFNQQAGRNTLSPGTIRQGVIAASRFVHRTLDWVASVTYADARFVRAAMDPGSTYFPADQGNMVPYVPSLVMRSDFGWAQTLNCVTIDRTPIRARAGLGATFVAPRNLPFAQVSDSMFVVDASLGAGWRWLDLAISAQNLFNSRYELGVYNYASNFVQDNPSPDMLPARHFTAGAPLTVMATLTLNFGRNEPAQDNAP